MARKHAGNNTPASLRKILVAIADPAMRKPVALAKAAQLAHATGAALELFHDIATPLMLEMVASRPGLRNTQRDIRAAALAQLERLAAPLRASGLVVQTAAQWDYPVHEAVIRQALHSGADLIVTQRRAQHHFATLLGYTDWSLLRDSPLPVLLVKSGRPWRQPAILAAIDPLHEYAKPSALDRDILKQATTVADAFGTSLHVVNAYLGRPFAPAQPGPWSGVSAGDAEATTRQDEATIRAAARARLDEALQDFAVAPARRHQIDGYPVDVIVNTARKTRAALVVVGAISRRGLKRAFIGNTAELLLDALPCDLLVVKPAGFTARIPRRVRGVRFIAPVTSY